LNKLLEAIIDWIASLPNLFTPAQLRAEVANKVGTLKFVPLHNIIADINNLPNNSFGVVDHLAFTRVVNIVTKYT
jgi:hypothetical protein